MQYLVKIHNQVITTDAEKLTQFTIKNYLHFYKDSNVRISTSRYTAHLLMFDQPSVSDFERPPFIVDLIFVSVISRLSMDGFKSHLSFLGELHESV